MTLLSYKVLQYFIQCCSICVFYQFFDAQVLSESGDDKLKEQKRSGQVSWLFESSDMELFNSLNSRVECFTELSLKFSEPYQIVNYGLGGHYVPHFDSFTQSHTKKVTSTFIRLTIIKTVKT